MADGTFVAAAPAAAAPILGDRSRWRRWWPDLSLEVVEDRGAAGVRWRIGGPVTGTMEIWCEPMLDGFVLHYFLHGEPSSALPGDAQAVAASIAEITRLRRVAGKEMSFEVKDLLEAGREVGGPAAAAPEQVQV